MAIFNYAAREMTAKIVYYGPGLSGKTTSLQYVHTKINPKNKGKLVSLATETDRTLFFDFFPVEFGQIGGFKVKFNFYTVPGQVFYNTTRKLVLKGADGVVFVGDSQAGMLDQNIESLDNLRENLKAHGIDWTTVPFVIQYNKRDLPGVMTVDEMRRQLNPRQVPDFETSATTGAGIMGAMKTICKMVLEDLQQRQKRAGASKGAEASPAAEQAAPAPATQRPDTAAAGGPLPASETPRKPAPRPAPAPEQPVSAQAAATPIERMISLPVKGPGMTSTSLHLPLQFQVEDGVEGIQVRVQVQVNYLTNGKGRVTVQEIGAEAPAAEAAVAEPVATKPPLEVPDAPPRKKGFFSRMFGSGE